MRRFLHPPFAAPLLMILGAACLVINDALVKLFAPGLPVGQVIAIRALATIGCCLVVLAKTRRPLPSPFSAGLLVRTGFTVANVFAFVAAITVLPFSLAVFVDLTNILFVTLLAPFLLSERLTAVKLVAVSMGVAGAGVMLSLELAQSGWLICLPLFSALMGAGRELWTRRLGRRYGVEVLTLYAAIAMVLIAVAQGTRGWFFGDPQVLAMLLVAGAFQAAAMLLMTLALQQGEASFVTPFRLTSLVWAALLAYAVFGERFTAAQGAGAALIGCALLLLSSSAWLPGLARRAVSGQA